MSLLIGLNSEWKINQNIKVKYTSPSPHIKLEFHSNYSLYLQWDEQGQLNLKYHPYMIIDCLQQWNVLQQGHGCSENSFACGNKLCFLVLMGYNMQKRLFHRSFLQICKEFPTRTLVFAIKLTGPSKTGQPFNIEFSEVKFPQALMMVANNQCSIQIGMMMFLQLQIWRV